MSILLMPQYKVAPAVVPATVSYTAQAVITTNSASPYTHSSQAIGTADASRQVVVGVNCQDSGVTVSALTVGGVSASQIIGATDGNNADNRVELWAASVPTGTTADIVVTYSGSPQNCCIGVWAIYGASTSAHDTASDDAAPNAPSIDIPAGGVCIGFANGQGTYSWTNLTESFDATMEGSTTYTGASDAFATAQTSLTITCDSSTNDQITVVASWGPT